MKTIGWLALCALLAATACSGGDTGQSGSSGADTATGAKNVKIKTVADAAKRIERISGCKWRYLPVTVENPAEYDGQAAYRFCNLGLDLDEELSRRDVTSRSFPESLVASYPYDPMYEGFVFKDIGGVYNRFALRLGNVNETTRKKFFAEIGLEQERFDALMEERTSRVRLDHFDITLDYAWLWYTAGDEIYLKARPLQPVSTERLRLSDFGKQIREIRQEAEEAQRKAAEEAEKEKQRLLKEREELGKATGPERYLFLTGTMTGNLDFSYYQFPPLNKNFRSESIALALASPEISVIQFIPYFYYLEGRKNGLTEYYQSPEELATAMTNTVDNRQVLGIAGLIANKHRELYDRIVSFHRGTIFEKNSQVDELRTDIATAIQTDIEDAQRTELLFPVFGEMVMRYDFDTNQFKPISDRIRLNIRYAIPNRQYTQNTSVTEYLVDGALTSLHHELGSLAIDVPVAQAQDYIEKFAQARFNTDDEFEFRFMIVFDKGAFAGEKVDLPMPTNMEQNFNGFQSGRFPHMVWKGACVTLVPFEYRSSSDTWRVGQHDTFAHGPTANAEPCEFMMRYIDAYAPIE